MWALITGASSGIGYCYAEELASRGYPLVIVSNEEAALCKAADRLARQYGVEICPIPMDLATADAADRLYEACRERNIRIDVLVNNAGSERYIRYYCLSGAGDVAVASACRLYPW